MGLAAHAINYRHIIEWLVRKPGAFRQYRFREDLFPSPVFRRAYDQLQEALPDRTADLEYLRILRQAARTMESEVERVLVELERLPGGSALDRRAGVLAATNFRHAGVDAPYGPVGKLRPVAAGNGGDAMTEAVLPSLLRSLYLTQMVKDHEPLADQAGREGWTFSTYLRRLCENEISTRARRRTERFLRESHLPDTKTMANLDQARLPAKTPAATTRPGGR